ncbi:MAG: hypothetical protein IIU94_06955, partial [Alistipes sp.]|nr:hypothetical protein [Alistipes sp.]
DIYPAKKERYMRWEGWRRNLRVRREEFRIAWIDHLDRMKKQRAKWKEEREKRREERAKR